MTRLSNYCIVLALLLVCGDCWQIVIHIGLDLQKAKVSFSPGDIIFWSVVWLSGLLNLCQHFRHMSL